MLALPDGADRSLLHIDGGGEIRLPDAERDDVPALAREFVDFGQDDKGVLGSELGGAAADPGHGMNDLGRERVILAHAGRGVAIIPLVNCGRRLC